jgi:hypothetical protein
MINPNFADMIIIVPNENSEKKIRNKHIVYAQQRNNILNNVLKIIGISDSNSLFYSHIISDNINIQQQLLDLTDDLKKYYATSTWSTFKNTIDVENKALSIVRMLLKEHNIKYKSTPVKIKIGLKTISSTQYQIINSS